MEEGFTCPVWPNHVDCADYNYGGVSCNVLDRFYVIALVERAEKIRFIVSVLLEGFVKFEVFERDVHKNRAVELDIVESVRQNGKPVRRGFDDRISTAVFEHRVEVMLDDRRFGRRLMFGVGEGIASEGIFDC